MKTNRSYWTRGFSVFCSKLHVATATAVCLLSPVSNYGGMPATQDASVTPPEILEAEGRKAPEWKAARKDLPESLIAPEAYALPYGILDYELTVGDTRHIFRLFRVAETVNQPQRYFVWPHPQTVMNPKPVAEMPAFVFSPQRDEERGLIRVLLKFQLMSEDVRTSDALKQKIWEVDQKYLKAFGVEDKSKIEVSYLPVTHGYVLLSNGGEEILVAPTMLLADTPDIAKVWITTTPEQLKMLDEASRNDGLEATWRFQYVAAAPALIANAEAVVTGSMVADAAAGLNAEQRAGKAPVFNAADRERVAEQLASAVRINVQSNYRYPGGVAMVNVADLLPVLFERRILEADELQKMIDDPAKRAALDEYLVPIAEKYHLQRADSEIKNKTGQKTNTRGGGGGFGFSLGPVSIGGGGSTHEQDVESFQRATSHAVEWKKDGTTLKPKRVTLQYLKHFDADTKQVVTKRVYSTKDGNGRYLYVQGSPVPIRAGANVYDQIAGEKAVEAKAMAELEAKKNDRLDRWRKYRAETNDKWHRGDVYTWNVPIDLVPGESEFKIGATFEPDLKARPKGQQLEPSIYVKVIQEAKDVGQLQGVSCGNWKETTPQLQDGRALFMLPCFESHFGSVFRSANDCIVTCNGHKYRIQVLDGGEVEQKRGGLPVEKKGAQFQVVGLDELIPENPPPDWK